MWALRNRRDGNEYTKFLHHDLRIFFEDVRFISPTNLRVRNFENQNRICRIGPVAWPPRYPDLIPLDIFV